MPSWLQIPLGLVCVQGMCVTAVGRVSVDTGAGEDDMPGTASLCACAGVVADRVGCV